MTACPSDETGKSSVAPWSSPMKSACGVVTGTLGKQKPHAARLKEMKSRGATRDAPAGRERKRW